MESTHFTLLQDGRPVGGSAALEQAVSAATRRAADTGKPVAVVAHTTGGADREAVFNPDGTNVGIWKLDRGKPMVPAAGQIYTNRGGGRYRCLSAGTGYGPVYFNAAGCASDASGVFRNVESGWTFTAKGIVQYVDGTIEWDHSVDGRFEEVSP